MLHRTILGASKAAAALAGLAIVSLGLISVPPSVAETLRDAEAGRASVQSIKARHAARWPFFGVGKVDSYHGQIVLSENENSVGAMLVSPESYCGDIKIRFDAMTLFSASVLVTSFAVQNRNSSGLAFPDGYDSNVDYMFDELSMYNFVLHPEAHNRPGPFLRRFPGPEKKRVSVANQSYMDTGKYHSIEVARQGHELWLAIDGARVVEWHDASPLMRGHFLLRVRGTAHERGAVLIRDLEVENNPAVAECQAD